MFSASPSSFEFHSRSLSSSSASMEAKRPPRLRTVNDDRKNVDPNGCDREEEATGDGSPRRSRSTASVRAAVRNPVPTRMGATEAEEGVSSLTPLLPLPKSWEAGLQLVVGVAKYWRSDGATHREKACTPPPMPLGPLLLLRPPPRNSSSNSIHHPVTTAENSRRGGEHLGITTAWLDGFMEKDRNEAERGGEERR